MFEQFNGNGNKKLFNVDVEKPVYVKLNSFNDGDVLQVLGVYVNKKSVYGEEPIFIVKNKDNTIFFVNIPKIHINTVNTIINNSDMIKGINDGECFIKVVKYFSKKYKKDCSNIEFINKPDVKEPKEQHDDIKEDTQECIF